MSTIVDWKKALGLFIVKIGVVVAGFTGWIKVHFNQGGVTKVERNEDVK